MDTLSDITVKLWGYGPGNGLRNLSENHTLESLLLCAPDCFCCVRLWHIPSYTPNLSVLTFQYHVLLPRSVRMQLHSSVFRLLVVAATSWFNKYDLTCQRRSYPNGDVPHLETSPSHKNRCEFVLQSVCALGFQRVEVGVISWTC